MDLPVQDEHRPTLGRFLLMMFGVVSGSTAVIMIKASTENALLVASYRLLVAAAALSPLFFRELKDHRDEYGLQQLSWSLVPAVILAVHFMSWVIGARMTTATNASLIANLTPVPLPFFLWILFRERVSRREVAGTALTLLGVVVLTVSNLGGSNTTAGDASRAFTGDLICFGSMLAFAAYLALGRKNGARIRLWLYMVPLYTIAGLVCLGAASFFVNPIKPYTLTNALLMLALGLVPTVFGHTILNYSMKFFRGQVVSVTNLTQPVFAGVLAFVFFGEVPSLIYFAAAALIVAGVLIVLRAGWKK